MLSLLRRKAQKHCGNDAIATSIQIYSYPFCACRSCTSWFLHIAVNAMHAWRFSVQNSIWSCCSCTRSSGYSESLVWERNKRSTLHRVLMPVTEQIGRNFAYKCYIEPRECLEIAFKLHSSSTFNLLRRSFLQWIGVPRCLVFYQHLTDLSFQMLLWNQFG